jgi:glycosyltransferase involved in cell wall biosynthesis
MPRKVLLIAHNHAAIGPGGVESHTQLLYESMRASPDFEPILLARAGPPDSQLERPHEATPLASINGDPNQYLFYSDPDAFDLLNGRSLDKSSLTGAFRDFLLAHQPDVIHFQHTLRLGYETIRIVRNTLPHAPIVYTLHEFMPICHRQGLMIRTKGDELCTHASPRRCRECFPDTTQQEFFLRERFIKSHLAVVDQFISPSSILLERFVEWGLPRNKMLLLENGQPGPQDSPEEVDRASRNRFGFFGTLSHFKGLDVLLKAMASLGPELNGVLRIHGANLDLQPRSFQEEVRELLGASTETVTLEGAYQRRDLSRLMADVDWVVVPSIWWENSPMVIQEAFLHGKPVICSDVGGMAEKVEHETSGLHFRRGDALSLAQTIRRAVAEPPLWHTLRAGIPQVPTMDDYLDALGRVYDRLLDGFFRAARRPSTNRSRHSADSVRPSEATT